MLNEQLIFCTFLRITSELDEIEYSIKRPTGLFLHALSDKAIKILVANLEFEMSRVTMCDYQLSFSFDRHEGCLKLRSLGMNCESYVVELLLLHDIVYSCKIL